MSIKLKIIFLLLIFVQGAAIYWSYYDNKMKEKELLKPYVAYLDNPLAVTKIDLNNEYLQEIAIDFTQFQNLEYLDLSNNLLQEIPNEIFELPKLKTLLLANNELYLDEALELDINNTIEKLDLSSNYFYNIADVICLKCFKQLKYLNLSRSSLESIPNLENSKIDTLILSDNSIKIEQGMLRNLPKNHLVKYLDLSQNAEVISNNSVATNMLKVNVQSINISNNNLDFPDYLFYSNYNNALKKIDLSYCEFNNGISILPENIVDTILLNNTNIEVRAETFSRCRNLKYLDLGYVYYYNLDLLNGSLEYLSLDLNENTFLMLPKLKTLNVNGNLGKQFEILFELGFDSKYLKDLNLPELETILIRDYENNRLDEILQKEFPDAKIFIESFSDEVEIDETKRQKLEEAYLNFIKTTKN